MLLTRNRRRKATKATTKSSSHSTNLWSRSLNTPRTNSLNTTSRSESLRRRRTISMGWLRDSWKRLEDIRSPLRSWRRRSANSIWSYPSSSLKQRTKELRSKEWAWRSNKTPISLSNRRTKLLADLSKTMKLSSKGWTLIMIILSETIMLLWAGWTLIMIILSRRWRMRAQLRLTDWRCCLRLKRKSWMIKLNG